MGCSVIGAVVLPLWMVFAASALYLVPGLGGDWMMDVETGDISFVYLPPIVLMVRGGMVGGMVLAMGTPLLGMGFLVASGFQVIGRRRRARQAAAYDDWVGDVELDVPLKVTKRGKSGRTAHALSITLGQASALRRLLSRVFDVLLLGATVLGAAMLGVLLDTAGVGWDGFTLLRPAGMGLVGGSLLLFVQWLGVYDRAQTLGMILFDVRIARRNEHGRPGFVRGVLLRHVLFDLLDAAVAVGLAVVVANLAVGWIAASPANGLFILDVLREVLYFAFWPLMLWVPLSLRSLPLLFGAPLALHDWVSGTWVVRTAVGERSTQRVPLGFRLLARMVDTALLALCAGAPLVLGMIVGGLLGPSSVVLGAIAAFMVGLMVMIGIWIDVVKHGSTPGKRLVGIRLRALDGDLNFINAVVVREWLALGGLSVALPVIGPVMNAGLALSDERRAIHDHLAGTEVVWDEGRDQMLSAFRSG